MRQEGVWGGAIFPVGELVGGILPGLSSKAHAGMDKAARVRPISAILNDKVNSSTAGHKRHGIRKHPASRPGVSALQYVVTFTARRSPSGQFGG